MSNKVKLSFNGYWIDCQANHRDVAKVVSNSIHHKFNGWPGVDKDKIEAQLSSDVMASMVNTDIHILKYGSDPIGLIGVSNLDWDSKFFGFKCSKVSHLYFDSTIQDKNYYKAKREFVSNAINSFCSRDRFILADISSNDSESNLLMQENGFKYVLSWIDGFYQGDHFQVELPADHHIDACTEADIEVMREIARDSYFMGGRFYMDPMFSMYDIADIYNSLIINSFGKDEIFVYRISDRPVGFSISVVSPQSSYLSLRRSVIRFIVVDQKHRGKGIATILFKSFINYLLGLSDIVTTGLEVHNIPSLNLHAKLGFSFNYVHNAYHRWQ